MSAKIKSSKLKTARRPKYKPKGVERHAFERTFWPYLPIVLIIAAVVGFSGQGSVLASRLRHPNGKVLAYATSMTVDGLLSNTNAQRSANGVAPLSLNSKLIAAAQAKASDMATRNYWSHNTPEGNPPWIFVTAQGYSYQKLGENLAAGFSNEQAVINGWMASAPHKANMLDTAFLEVGFGSANNADYTAAGGGPMTIVVAFYGKPTGAPAPPPPAPVATPPPPPSAVAGSSNNSSPSATVAPPATAPSPEPPPTPSPAEAPSNKKDVPAPTTSQTPINDLSSAGRTTLAQTNWPQAPLVGWLSAVAAFSMVAAGGFWLTRHVIALRRTLIAGHNWAIHHPLFEISLLIIAAVGFLMSQTAGFIK